MNYIINSINGLGFKVIVISLSMLKTKEKFFVKGGVEKIRNNLKVKYFSSFRVGGIITSFLNTKLLPLKLFFFLIFHVKKNDKVIVYHNTCFSIHGTIGFLKSIVGFSLILEVEELYSNVESSISFSNEKKVFDLADKYIFPTELLENVVNTSLKPSLIIYGSYEINYDDLLKFYDNKIHVVYAGTFDSRKGGAAAAAAAAAFLPKDYVVHIMGFGTDSQIQLIKSTINETSKITVAKIIYEGCLLGKEYTDFLQKCDIGLSTQNPENIYNSTSFPSKILSYMANGLQVVSIEIDAIKKSKIGDQVFYYRKNKPKEIAKAIIELGKNIGNLKDPRNIIKILQEEFNLKLQELLTL